MAEKQSAVPSNDAGASRFKGCYIVQVITAKQLTESGCPHCKSIYGVSDRVFTMDQLSPEHKVCEFVVHHKCSTCQRSIVVVGELPPADSIESLKLAVFMAVNNVSVFQVHSALSSALSKSAVRGGKAF